MSSENMKVWDQLSRTDPKHTKSFKRAGGFTGTAIKPIYQLQKMTEAFGSVGDGWGMTEPVFQVVPGVNQEVLVFCTVGIWRKDTLKDGGIFYGVGGDKVVTHIKANEQYKRAERWENDDEAFKKAFTDAVGNAMKHLGMSADVHMGLFDDSKYVREREAEEAGADRQTGEIRSVMNPPLNSTPNLPMDGVPDVAEEMSNTAAKAHWKTIADALFACTTLVQLQGAWSRHYRVYEQLPANLQSELLIWKDELKGKLLDAEDAKKAPPKAANPDFSKLQPNDVPELTYEQKIAGTP